MEIIYNNPNTCKTTLRNFQQLQFDNIEFYESAVDFGFESLFTIHFHISRFTKHYSVSYAMNQQNQNTPNITNHDLKIK